MKGIAFLSGFIGALVTSSIILPAHSQVLSDGTTNTTINTNNNNFDILDGIQKGNNLFHSFKEFSIPTGGSATFNNSTDVVNIINRVTGGNISNIDGLIKANGNANLFLINPAGIVFGENARLDIGGSFLGSTAESILFEDGFEFSAVNPQSTPLLTVSVPLGLQMGQDSGAIQVNASGHQLTGGSFNPVIRNNTQSTLQVNSGKAIALVGKNLNVNGGVLTAENGRLELGAVKTGAVNINYTSSNLELNYDNVENFGDIQLINQSLVDASGFTSGGIQLQGQNINIKDGSMALIQNTGSQTPRGIKVSANGSLEIAGDTRIAPDRGGITGVTSSSLFAETLGSGKGAEIDVDAGDLRLNDGGQLKTRTYATGFGGDINANIARDIQIDRTAPLIPITGSGFSANTYSSGSSGNINIIASNIAIADGGIINSANLGQGSSGNLNVNVSGTLELKGIESRTSSASNIGSTVFAQGNGGSVNINTARLVVEDGAVVNSSTFESGNGGKITINASESVEVSGSSPNGELNSRIRASAPILPPVLRQILGLPNLPTGNGGSLTINTPKLLLDNGGEVSVNNKGSGNAGNLSINGNSLRLDNKGQLLANTTSGEGGNINLNLQSDLILRNNSFINTEAFGTGNGGNININSPIIAGFGNSDIIANAVEGNGGNIDITTSGIFGLEFRDELTEESDITASSQFGINGTVQINNISVDPSSGLTELPVTLADSSQQIASGCSRNTRNSFVATGKGGIPQNPNEQVDAKHTWSDIRDLSAFGKGNNAQAATISQKPAIVEATGFIRNSNGEIELVALENTPFTIKQVGECSGAST